MPRRDIELNQRVEYLSILDENGVVDKELEPELSNELLLKLHGGMLFARRFDERMLILQRQGRIGTFAPIKGQEAQVGVAAALEPGDWTAPSFREMPMEVWRGKDPLSVLLLYGGFNEGAFIPPDLNSLPVSIPVGSQLLHAVGIAYGMKYRKTQDVAVSFFGDGATSEGDFHEALNFASVFQLPVIFVCQNNHWAISVPRAKQTRAATIAQKGLAYAMPSIQVDGNDVLAVYAAVKEAVERGRSGGGPTLIECVTYRLSVHTTADDPKKYRTDEEVADWIKRDPLIRFEKYLRDKGLLTDDTLGDMEAEALRRVKDAEDRYEKTASAPVDPVSMFDHAYAELPADLVAQREAFRREPTPPHA